MCKLLEIARAKQGNISYWEIARRLNVSDQVMNKWKNDKAKPNGINALKLADMAELTPKQAIEIMESGFVDLSLLKVTALGAMAYPAWSLISKVCILCKIKSELARLFSALFAMFKSVNGSQSC